MRKSLPDFSKKLVSLGLIGDVESYALDRPVWENQGGRLFLIGKVPRGASTRDWCEGLIASVAWDRVTDYLIFDSAKHYRKQLAIYKKRRRKD
jgi:hypothetical protein